MAILALATLDDGTRVLLMALTAEDRTALGEQHRVQADIPAEHQTELGFDRFTLIPSERGEFLDLMFKLEVQGLGCSEQKH
jgi:hypothetical protein